MVYNWLNPGPKRDRRPLEQRVKEHVLKFYRDRGYRIENDRPIQTNESRENYERYQERCAALKAKNKRR